MAVQAEILSKFNFWRRFGLFKDILGPNAESEGPNVQWLKNQKNKSLPKAHQVTYTGKSGFNHPT